MRFAYLSVPLGQSVADVVKSVREELDCIDDVVLILEPDHETKQLRRLLRLGQNGKIPVLFFDFGNDPLNEKEKLFVEASEDVIHL